MSPADFIDKNGFRSLDFISFGNPNIIVENILGKSLNEMRYISVVDRIVGTFYNVNVDIR